MKDHQRYAEHLKQTDPELYDQLFGNADDENTPGCLGLSILIALLLMLILAIIFQ